MFETAIVNEPSVFELLKLYCNTQVINMTNYIEVIVKYY